MSEDSGGIMDGFNNIMNEVGLTVIGFFGGLVSLCLFISVYPVMPFIGILSFVAAILKTFFYKFRKL